MFNFKKVFFNALQAPSGEAMGQTFQLKVGNCTRSNYALSINIGINIFNIKIQFLNTPEFYNKNISLNYITLKHN